MNMIVAEVYLPASGKSYEIRVPAAMNTLLAAHLTADGLENLSGGTYRSSRSSVFAWQENGKVHKMEKSLEEANVRNGSKLLLI